eukprot:357634-Chlamydomonas_euryale.AAC.1
MGRDPVIPRRRVGQPRDDLEHLLHRGLRPPPLLFPAFDQVACQSTQLCGIPLSWDKLRANELVRLLSLSLSLGSGSHMCHSLVYKKRDDPEQGRDAIDFPKTVFVYGP